MHLSLQKLNSSSNRYSVLRYKMKSDSYLYIRVVSRGTRAIGPSAENNNPTRYTMPMSNSCTHSRRANRGKTAQNKVNKRSHEMRAKWSKLPLAAQCKLCSIIHLTMRHPFQYIRHHWSLFWVCIHKLPTYLEQRIAISGWPTGSTQFA